MNLDKKTLSTTAFHTKANMKLERCNKTNMTRLRGFVAEHQRDWDILFQLLTYVYNSQVQRSTHTTLFRLVLSCIRPGAASIDERSNFSWYTHYPTEPHALRRQILAHVAELRAQLDTSLASAQSRYRQDFDRSVRRANVFLPRHLENVNKPPLAATTVKDANRMATETPNKPILKTLVPFIIVKVIWRHISH